MIDRWFMEVPKAFQQAYKLGKVRRYGSLLKDVSSGKIVGHLRESHGFLKAMSNINLSAVNIEKVALNFTKVINKSNPLQFALDILNTISNTVVTHKIHQQGDILKNQNQTLEQQSEILNKLTNLIDEQADLLLDQKKALKQVIIQLDRLGLVTNISAYMSIATFGLCAIQFGMITSRLGEIDKKLDKILERLDELEANVIQNSIDQTHRQYLAELQSALELLNLSASESQTTDCIKSCLNTFNIFQPFLLQTLQEPSKIKLDDFLFLYNVLVLSTMGIIRGYSILDKLDPVIDITTTRIQKFNEINQQFNPNKIFQYRLENKLFDYSNQQKEFDTLYRVINITKENYTRIDSQLQVFQWLKDSKKSLKSYSVESENIENPELIFYRHLD